MMLFSIFLDLIPLLLAMMFQNHVLGIALGLACSRRPVFSFSCVWASIRLSDSNGQHGDFIRVRRDVYRSVCEIERF